MGTATRSSLVVKQNEGEEAEKAGGGKEMARLPSRRQNQVCAGVRSSRSGRKRAERAGVTKREGETASTLLTVCPVSYEACRKSLMVGDLPHYSKTRLFKAGFSTLRGGTKIPLVISKATAVMVIKG